MPKLGSDKKEKKVLIGRQLSFYKGEQNIFIYTHRQVTNEDTFCHKGDKLERTI